MIDCICYLIRPYDDGWLIASQVLSIIATLLSWIWWPQLILSMVGLILSQVFWFCRQQKSMVYVTAVVAVLASLVSLGVGIWSLIVLRDYGECGVFVFWTSYTFEQMVEDRYDSPYDLALWMGDYCFYDLDGDDYSDDQRYSFNPNWQSSDSPYERVCGYMIEYKQDMYDDSLDDAFYVDDMFFFDDKFMDTYNSTFLKDEQFYRDNNDYCNESAWASIAFVCAILWAGSAACLLHFVCSGMHAKWEEMHSNNGTSTTAAATAIPVTDNNTIKASTMESKSAPKPPAPEGEEEPKIVMAESDEVTA